MVENLSLSQIAKANSFVLIDNCILCRSGDYIDIFNGENAPKTLENALDIVYDYNSNLFDFISKNSHVYVTNGIYREFLKGFFAWSNISNLAFNPIVSLDSRKKIAKIYSYYPKIKTVLEGRIAEKNNLCNTIDLERLCNLSNSFISDKVPLRKSISINDISMYCFLENLSRKQNSAILTRDFDLSKLKKILGNLSGFGLEEKKKELESKIYVPFNPRNSFNHEYRILN